MTFIDLENEIPITELSNIKSKNIDILNPEDIAKAIYECETEIFGGYENYDGVFDNEIITKCLNVSHSINRAIEENGLTNIVLIGTGTSGRLCMFIAKLLKQLLKNQKINLIPIIAGGIKALIRAEPNTEDNFNIGFKDYYKYTAGIDRTNCFLFGVSCGLSAYYVSGALYGNLKHSKYPSILIGFNPVEQSAINLVKHNNLIIINPIVGPEPIVGSVRMKGGTTTMFLLQAIITAGMNQHHNIPPVFKSIINESKNTLEYILENNIKIAELISNLGNTLNNKGHIHILGSSIFGALGIFDAAECPPTFGAFEEQVNGYTPNGISDLIYYEYESVETLPKNISFDGFFSLNISQISPNDSIVFIADKIPPLALLKRIQNCICSNFVFLLLEETNFNINKINNFQNYKVIVFNHHWVDLFQKALFVRSILLRLSTGGFILNGKVFENKMIDLRITNKKLFHRALRMISQITGLTETEIYQPLLKNIYNGSVVNNQCLSECINNAASKSHIVPKTILTILYPEKSNKEIDVMLKDQPIIRKLIENELSKIGDNVVN